MDNQETDNIRQKTQNKDEQYNTHHRKLKRWETRTLKKTTTNRQTKKKPKKKQKNKETREVQKFVINQLGFYFKFGYNNYTQLKSIEVIY